MAKKLFIWLLHRKVLIMCFFVFFTHKGAGAFVIYTAKKNLNSLQSTGKRGFQEGTDFLTDIAIYRPNWPRGQFSEILIT